MNKVFICKVIKIEKILKISVAVLLVILLLTVPNISAISTSSVNDYPLLGFCIVLDAGHGGEDGGAIGISTLVREKDINLQIVKKIQRLFESAGATVVLTRKDENALCSGKYSKIADMRARKSIIENAQPYIVISVHCNSFPQDKSSQGAQMFYFPGSESGKQLAESIQNSIKSNLDQDNNRKVKSENFYMLRAGNAINVMIECGFLSSPTEEKMLCEEKYQDKIAYCVFDGTNKFIYSLRPESS